MRQRVNDHKILMVVLSWVECCVCVCACVWVGGWVCARVCVCSGFNLVTLNMHPSTNLLAIAGQNSLMLAIICGDLMREYGDSGGEGG